MYDRLLQLMFPTLFSIGKLNISSFNVFLVLSFLYGIFLVWRLVRAWDIDEEKSLDLTFLTLAGGLIGSRIIFVLEHLEVFIRSLPKIILIYQQPGFSAWGGVVSGFLTLYFFSRRFKIDYWQVSDLGAVAFLGSLILANLGCLPGGCDTVNVFGSGRKFPVAGIEALLLLAAFLKIWPVATHFHIRGKVVSLVLINLGIIRLLTAALRQIRPAGYLSALILIATGTILFYRVTKRNFKQDLKNYFELGHKIFTDSDTRKSMMQSFSKWWYNQKTSFVWKVNNMKKRIRRLYVRSS